MAEIKDKVVTVESLSTLHEHNKKTYVAKTDVISIDNGGTGATTSEDALVNLGLTATADELNYCDGVTSNIQTQLNDKAASSHDHDASDIISGTLSSDRLPTVPISNGGTGATTSDEALVNLGLTATADELNIMDGITATTDELNYVGGVTSSIQEQLNNKADSVHAHDYLPLSGGELTGAVRTKGLVLTDGVDYGEDLPDAGIVGRIFFKKIIV